MVDDLQRSNRSNFAKLTDSISLINYLDTNIWVAAFIAKHPQHISSKQLIADCLEQNIEIVTSAHCFGRGLFGAD